MGMLSQTRRSSPLRSAGRWIPRIIARLLVGIYVVAILIPLYYLIVSSFKDNASIFSAPLSLPSMFSLRNFLTAQDDVDLIGGIGNSLVITVGAELLTLVLAVPAAYAIARVATRIGFVVERLFSLGFLIPAFALLVPTFLLSIKLGLYHSQLFLILFYPATALPLSVLLMAQFMRSIPPEIEEAARVDGGTRLSVLWRIFIPLCLPGMATIAILNFLSFWNEYLFARIILNDDSRTIQVALPALKSFQLTDYGLVTAGTLVALIPVYIVYAVLQRRMQEALISGYAKG
jgi:multiple sugar transport system permease protein